MAITKALEGKGTLEEKEYLKKLENLMASETAAEEKNLSDFMDMKYEEALRQFLKNNPDKSEKDFQDAIIRIPMNSGGKVIDFAKYAKAKDPKVKELDLASLFTPDKTLASLSKSERAAVNDLLKLTFGKKD
ncbi:MAG: hypothetical protein ACR2MI_03180 [Flavobacteriaceae bacterium]|tara:strand:+ start:115 stop:510 length:396 start_codon:yes stop_codon:yes gene_type:complete